MLTAYEYLIYKVFVFLWKLFILQTLHQFFLFFETILAKNNTMNSLHDWLIANNDSVVHQQQFMYLRKKILSISSKSCTCYYLLVQTSIGVTECWYRLENVAICSLVHYHYDNISYFILCMKSRFQVFSYKTFIFQSMYGKNVITSVMYHVCRKIL